MKPLPLPLPQPALTLLIEAFFSTDITHEPADIIALYVRRWQIEVTFAETRAIWASRHSVNGPTKPSLEPPRHFSGFTA
jgi:hypothetical protein